MINYLTDLIARNRNEVETIQPRVPSRFEPQTTALHFEVSEFAATEDSETAETFPRDLEVANLSESAPVALPSFRAQSAIEQEVETESAPPLFQAQARTAPAKSAEKKTGVDARRGPPVAAPLQDNQNLGPFTKDDRPQEHETSFSVELSPPPKLPQAPAVQVRKTVASEEVRSVAQPGAERRPRDGEIRSLKTPSKSEAEVPHPSNDETSETARTENPRPRDATRSLKRDNAAAAVERFHVGPDKDAGNTAIVRPIVKTAKAKQRMDPAPGREQHPYLTPSLDSPREKSELNVPSRKMDIEPQSMVRQTLPPLARAEGETLTGVSDAVRRQNSPRREPLMVVPRLLERVRREDPTLPEPVDTSPTINISIGRIEVRATTVPTTTAAPKARHEHVLSLEQYLKERVSGGGS
jgi:hypothetical protein